MVLLGILNFFAACFFYHTLTPVLQMRAFRVSLGYPALLASQPAVLSGFNIWSIASKVWVWFGVCLILIVVPLS